MNKESVKECILEVIDEYENEGPINLQLNIVLPKVAERLKVKGNIENEQFVLSVFHELFITGYLAWGYNIDSPKSPFFHKARKS